MRNIIFSLPFIFPALTGFANPNAWQIEADKSSISFTAVQNNSPVTGNFSKFDGEIVFLPENLKASRIRMVIDMASVNVAYEEVAQALKTAEWFNIKLFPEAVFDSSEILRTGDGNYKANGTLEIRGNRQPVSITFVFEEYSEMQAIATGGTDISRTAFGVGQEQWEDTKAVRDKVGISFTISAIREE